MSVTCQKTFTFGLLVRIVNRFWLISRASMAGTNWPDHDQLIADIPVEHLEQIRVLSGLSTGYLVCVRRRKGAPSSNGGAVYAFGADTSPTPHRASMDRKQRWL
jgi:hypothetical protein